MTRREHRESPDELTPPQDYPLPHWQDEPAAGDYWVPPYLRPYYSAAEPSESKVEGFIRSGVSISQDVEVERPRAIGGGREIVRETVAQTQLIHLSGPGDYRRWLHIERLDLAATLKGNADRAAATLAAMPTCQVCGVRAYGVLDFAESLPSGPTFRVRVCPRCQPLTLARLRERLFEQDARRVLDDGRTLAEHVDQAVERALTGEGHSTL
jgi:hypothetical protein